MQIAGFIEKPAIHSTPNVGRQHSEANNLVVRGVQMGGTPTIIKGRNPRGETSLVVTATGRRIPAGKEVGEINGGDRQSHPRQNHHPVADGGNHQGRGRQKLAKVARAKERTRCQRCRVSSNADAESQSYGSSQAHSSCCTSYGKRGQQGPEAYDGAAEAESRRAACQFAPNDKSEGQASQESATKRLHKAGQKGTGQIEALKVGLHVILAYLDKAQMLQQQCQEQDKVLEDYDSKEAVRHQQLQESTETTSSLAMDRVTATEMMEASDISDGEGFEEPPDQKAKKEAMRAALQQQRDKMNKFMDMADTSAV